MWSPAEFVKFGEQLRRRFGEFRKARPEVQFRPGDFYKPSKGEFNARLSLNRGNVLTQLNLKIDRTRDAARRIAVNTAKLLIRLRRYRASNQPRRVVKSRLIRPGWIASRLPTRFRKLNVMLLPSWPHLRGRLAPRHQPRGPFCARRDRKCYATDRCYSPVTDRRAAQVQLLCADISPPVVPRNVSDRESPVGEMGQMMVAAYLGNIGPNLGGVGGWGLRSGPGLSRRENRP